MFDLDETLIHCNESTDIPSDIILPIKFPSGETIEVMMIMLTWWHKIILIYNFNLNMKEIYILI